MTVPTLDLLLALPLLLLLLLLLLRPSRFMVRWSRLKEEPRMLLAFLGCDVANDGTTVGVWSSGLPVQYFNFQNSNKKIAL